MSFTARLGLDGSDYIREIRTISAGLQNFQQEAERATATLSRLDKAASTDAYAAATAQYNKAAQAIGQLSPVLQKAIKDYGHLQQQLAKPIKVDVKGLKALSMPEDLLKQLDRLSKSTSKLVGTAYANPLVQQQLDVQRFSKRAKEAITEVRNELKQFGKENAAVLAASPTARRLFAVAQGTAKEQAQRINSIGRLRRPEAVDAKRAEIIDNAPSVDNTMAQLYAATDKAARSQAKKAVQTILTDARLADTSMTRDQAINAGRLEREMTTLLAQDRSGPAKETLQKLLTGSANDFLKIEAQNPQLAATAQQWQRSVGDHTTKITRYNAALDAATRHLTATSTDENPATILQRKKLANSFAQAYSTSSTQNSPQRLISTYVKPTSPDAAMLAEAFGYDKLETSLVTAMRQMVPAVVAEPKGPPTLDPALVMAAQNNMLARQPKIDYNTLSPTEKLALDTRALNVADAYQKTGRSLDQFEKTMAELGAGSLEAQGKFKQLTAAVVQMDQALDGVTKRADQRAALAATEESKRAALATKFERYNDAKDAADAYVNRTATDDPNEILRRRKQVESFAEAYSTSRDKATPSMLLDALSGDKDGLLSQVTSELVTPLRQLIPPVPKTPSGGGGPKGPAGPVNRETLEAARAYMMARIPEKSRGNMTDAEKLGLDVRALNLAQAYEKTGKPLDQFTATLGELNRGSIEAQRGAKDLTAALLHLNQATETIDNRLGKRGMANTAAKSQEEVQKRLLALQEIDPATFISQIDGKRLGSHSRLQQMDVLSSFDGVQQAFAKTNEPIENFFSTFKKLRSADPETMRMFPELTKQVRGFEASLNRLDPTNLFDVLTHGRNLSRLMAARVITMGFYELTAAISQSTRNAIELSQRVAEIQTITQDMPRDTESLFESIYKVSDKYNFKLNKVAESYYETLSNQIGDAYSVEGITEKLGGFSKTTRSGIDSSMNLYSSLINAYDVPTSQSDDVLAQIFALVDRGRVRPEDMANTVGRVAAIAPAAGVTMPELFTMVAELTIAGVKFERASTYITNVLNKLSKPTPAMHGAFERWGVNGPDEALANFGVMGILNKLHQDNPNNLSELGVTWRDIRAMQGAGLLTRNGAGGMNETLDAIENSIGPYNKALEMVMQSSGEILSRETNKIMNILNRWTDWGIDKLADVDRWVNITANEGGQNEGKYTPTRGVHASDIIEAFLPVGGLLALSGAGIKFAEMFGFPDAKERRILRSREARKAPAKTGRWASVKRRIAPVAVSATANAGKFITTAALGLAAHEVAKMLAKIQQMWKDDATAQKFLLHAYEKEYIAAQTKMTEALQKESRKREKIERQLKANLLTVWGSEIADAQLEAKLATAEMTKSVEALNKELKTQLDLMGALRDYAFDAEKAERELNVAFITDPAQKNQAKIANAASIRDRVVETFDAGKPELANRYFNDLTSEIASIRGDMLQQMQTVNEAMLLRDEAYATGGKEGKNLLNQADQRISALGIKNWNEDIPAQMMAAYNEFNANAAQEIQALADYMLGPNDYATSTDVITDLTSDIDYQQEAVDMLSKMDEKLKELVDLGYTSATAMEYIEKHWSAREIELTQFLSSKDPALLEQMDTVLDSTKLIEVMKTASQADAYLSGQDAIVNNELSGYFKPDQGFDVLKDVLDRQGIQAGRYGKNDLALELSNELRDLRFKFEVAQNDDGIIDFRSQAGQDLTAAVEASLIKLPKNQQQLPMFTEPTFLKKVQAYVTLMGAGALGGAGVGGLVGSPGGPGGVVAGAASGFFPGAMAGRAEAGKYLAEMQYRADQYAASTEQSIAAAEMWITVQDSGLELLRAQREHQLSLMTTEQIAIQRNKTRDRMASDPTWANSLTAEEAINYDLIDDGGTRKLRPYQDVFAKNDPRTSMEKFLDAENNGRTSSEALLALALGAKRELQYNELSVELLQKLGLTSQYAYDTMIKQLNNLIAVETRALQLREQAAKMDLANPYENLQNEIPASDGSFPATLTPEQAGIGPGAWSLAPEGTPPTSVQNNSTTKVETSVTMQRSGQSDVDARGMAQAIDRLRKRRQALSGAR